MTDEVRAVSATGGEKGRKSAELAAIDPLALLTLAEVAGFGARKYAAFNYLKGYDWSLNANAALRHLLAFLNGEDLDPESGLPHTAHFAWHGLALTSFLQRGLGTDDRFKQPEPDLEPMPVWDAPVSRPFLSGEITVTPGSGPSMRDAISDAERRASLA